jgi:hypothetical protein
MSMFPLVTRPPKSLGILPSFNMISAAVAPILQHVSNEIPETQTSPFQIDMVNSIVHCLTLIGVMSI